MFDVLLYLLLVSSCVIVEDVPFEVVQEPSFEEVEPQFLEDEGKWICSPSILFFVLITCILSHFKF
jgi:hypothetical protein